LLHDLGRVVLDDPGLTKQGRLSNEEWATVRLHPQEGAIAILAAAGAEHETAALVALEHHLRPDGSGYPDLGDRSPHLFSRLVAVADAYDAITSYRPYRPARTPHEALQILMEGSGTAYDADLVEAFVGMMGDFPPGSLLRLEDGEVVMVTALAGGGRGAVMVRDVAGAILEQPEPIDLAGRRVAAQLLADEAGIDPASLLEAVEAGA
jgi:HD-GYP domain-containing protein (c-di-GMP phosphodiesterase class II)